VRVRGKSGRYSAKVQVPASRKGALSRVINPQTVNQWSSNITSVMYFELDDCPVNTLRHARFITFTYDCVHSSICGRLFAGGPISLGTLSPIRIPADFGFRRDTTTKVCTLPTHLISGFTSDGRLQQRQVKLFFDHTSTVVSLASSNCSP
jgi:hypothetical protein